MLSYRPALIAALVWMALSSGCTDRDRELARRTGDGADTFKYQPPAGPIPPPPNTEGDKPPARDGSDTFHYKRDPRTYPKQPKKQGE